jgi:2-oxoacid:acceptor oxidoreductase gamma subunit (pyruvate/2-ketoisovalerate family)
MVFEVRIHGRGGQGVVTAAEILSIAAFVEGQHAQAFPSFGFERTGAPVVAFCRIDDREIGTREPIAEPDALIIQDPTLLHQVDVFSGLTADGYVLTNSSRSFEELGLTDLFERHARERLLTVPATDIAREKLGRPIPNAALLGGFAALSRALSVESVAEAIREKFPGKIAGGNVAAAKAAFQRVRQRMKVVIEKMELDETGFPQPTGELEELKADSVVLALGQDTDLSLLDGVEGIEVEDGVVKVARNMMTGHEGVFAGGDMVPDERTVPVGIGHGKKAARHIDGWLAGRPYEQPPRHELATFDKLNTWYYSDAPRTERAKLDMARRRGTFEEVIQGLDEDNALFEARRCLSCGSCFSCDNCYGVCPDNAVIKRGEPGELYEIDLDFCNGCGMCVAECPSGAIRMEPEEI